MAEKVVDQVGGSLSPTSHRIAVERAIAATLRDVANANGGTMTSIGGKMVTQSIERSGTRLSEGQVYMVINRVCARQLDEGVWDSVKGAAGKAVDWAKTKGKNLTTTITADKLNSAWQTAGAPTDSEELKQFLTAQGVEAGVIDSVYNSLKIVSGAAKEEPAAQSMYAQIKKDVQTLDKKGRQRIMAYLQKQLGTA
jgi:phospholipase/lecithinase/hemolysin